MTDLTEKPHTLETNATLSPTEAIPAHIRVLVDVGGAVRTGRDVMVAFSTSDDPRFPTGYGFFDMMLTWAQAEELRAELDKAIARKPAP